jgi:hypothetical protein
VSPVAVPAEAFDHGDPRRYRRGCRCNECKAGVVADNKRNKLLRETGRSSLIDSARTAIHLRALRSAGMSDAEIRTATGLCPDLMYRILRGDGRIRRGTERRVLAVAVPARERHANHAVTDSTGTRRRLQALVAAGWPGSEIAFRLGVFKEQVSYLLRGCGGGQVTLRVEAEVRRVYLDLWDQRPESHGVARGMAVRARLHAARRGWHPAGVWDDIDNPDDRPQYGEWTARETAIVEDAAELARQGLSREAIAARLGATWDYVAKAHSRQAVPLPPIAA